MLPYAADSVFTIYSYTLSNLSQLQFGKVFLSGEFKNGRLLRVEFRAVLQSGTLVHLLHMLSEVRPLTGALFSLYMEYMVSDVFVGDGVD